MLTIASITMLNFHFFPAIYFSHCNINAFQGFNKIKDKSNFKVAPVNEITNCLFVNFIISSAEEDLEQLNDHLNKRKTQLQDAGDKLSLIQQAIDDQVL